MTERLCSIDGCDKSVESRGWCNAHYQRWLRHGEPTAGGSYRNPGAICAVDNCDRVAQGRGYCDMHYKRVRKYGTTELPPKIKAERPPCSISGCVRPAKSRGWCETHYFRWYRTGNAGDAEILVKGLNSTGLCTHDDCSKPVKGMMLYCSMHLARNYRHGDMDTVKTPERKWGEENPNWVGEDVGYGGAHCRIYRARGNATEYPCVDCFDQAAQWSYRHGSERENTEWMDGKLVPYSPDPMDYDPRCVPCHKAFDLAHLRGA